MQKHCSMEIAAIRAASWVLGNALSPLSDGVLEAWGASSMLGSNMGDLKLELLEAQAMLDNVRGRETHNPSLAQLLDKLRQLAYVADDVLDELDYFRIQDELDGTYHAADAHAAGRVKDLALNARHTARACVNKLKFPMSSRAVRREDPDGNKQGFLSGLRFCGGHREIGSSSPSPANLPKAARNVGKHFSCFSFLPPADHDTPIGVVENPNLTGENGPLQTPKLKFDRVEMSKKILDIIKHLKPVCAKVSNILRSVPQASSRNHAQDITMNRPQTTPQIIEPNLYGRDKHKKIVTDEIVNGEFCELTVLPIVGPGGIGKTTFTQHIYEQMKGHFMVTIWICVSLDFNANRLVKEIVKMIPEVNNEKQNCSDVERIQQRLKGKRVLLVLDDVWKHQENEWKKIIALLTKDGAMGNMVIVTTRIPEVANTVKTTKHPLELERLCIEDISSFFEECVFGDQKPWLGHENLSCTGSKILGKLKGSPLAAKTVGRLLRNTLTLDHWRRVLESKEWELETDENDIMPALKLSYDYLPFYLQQCFSFCGLFPEDYEFGREELVHFWIELDILHSCDQKGKQIEDVGLCSLDDLVNQGFFKMNKKGDQRPYYVIHDLLHELAVKVSSYECLSISSSNVRCIQILPSVRHLSIIIDNTDIKDRKSFEEYNENLSALDKQLKVKHLRTLMLFGDCHGSFAKTFSGLFREAMALRVIFLSESSYNVEDILHNFSKLVHLRYLRIKPAYNHQDFSYSTEIRHWELSLPSVLFRLYHLEVIDVQFVENCVSSTRYMSSLVKLRHFVVSKCMLHLQAGIYGVGKLKFLQELREFRVGKESEGFELSQLGPLTEIRGALRIYNLERVQTKEEADKLKLIHKNHIKELVLQWDTKRPNKNPIQEETVLGSLVPHSDLQELRIEGHGGTNCPAWLSANLSLGYLESLSLDGVSWKNLPPLGDMWMVNEQGEEYQDCSTSPSGFHNLKRLELSNISRLIKWVGNAACPLFFRLEVLIIKDCSELIELPFSHPPTCSQVQWKEKVGWFPRLRELVIFNCPKLVSLLPIPWRTGAPCSAQIARVGSGIEQLNYTLEFGQKLNLRIAGKSGQGGVFRSGLDFSNLTDLEELYMTNVPPLPLDHLRVLTSLNKVRITGLSRLLPRIESDRCHGIYRFPVEDLEICQCDTSGKELTLLLSFLPNLSKFRLDECKNITGLGVVEDAETVSRKQRQQTRVGEEEIITGAAAEGLLLLPPQLQELEISDCDNVILLRNPLHDHHTAAGEGGLQRLRSLRMLDVSYCPEFLASYSSSSSSVFPFPTCLQNLTLWDVKYMQTLQALSNLTFLTDLYLEIQGDARDDGLWPLLAHGRLTNLNFRANPYFFIGSQPSCPHEREVFSRSSKLFRLSTDENTGFLAGPICSLLSSTLTRLDLILEEEGRLTKEQEEALQLLTALQELTFYDGHGLPAELHQLSNLEKLDITCSGAESLPSLPSSLRELEISHCDAIKSLPNSLPSSLEKLRIWRCDAIKSLPKDSLPGSMREVDVRLGNSKELKRACRKLIGTIPIIKVDPF